MHDEAHYVVRRADGTPLSVPAWMMRPEAAFTEIVPVARLPVPVLLELRRLTVTCLSSRVHDACEEDHDAAATSDTPTATLRRTSGGSRRPTPAGGTSAAATGTGAVDAGAGQDDQRGAQR